MNKVPIELNLVAIDDDLFRAFSDGFDPHPEVVTDFPELSSREALYACQLLERILDDLSFRRMLVVVWLTLTDGKPDQSNFPEWAYETAYRLEDPHGVFNAGEKIGIENLCRELVEEYETGDRFFTEAHAEDTQTPGFLAMLVDALLANCFQFTAMTKEKPGEQE
jgi:hypothetical protein